MHQFNLSRRSFLKGTAAIAGIAPLALAGCGSNQNNNSTNANNEQKTSQTITASVGYSASNFNPVGNSSALALAANWHVLEGLYDLDLTTYKTYNALAASDPVKQIENVYEITIRDGAKFSTGDVVTAEDVVNAFVRNMADETYKPLLSFIESVSVKGSNVVSFKLKYTFETLLKKRLSIVKIFPMSMTDDELAVKPIGSGPWKYEKIDGSDGGEISFAINDEYNGSKKAENEKMSWKVTTDDSARADAVMNGDSVAVENLGSSFADQAKNSGKTIEYVPGFSQAFLMFNTKKPPFDDKRVRQAIFYAIDIDKLISQNMAGHAKAVSSFLPETFSNYHKASTVFSFDQERAKSLLAEAGHPNISLTLTVHNNWVKDLAPQIKENLDSCGIATTIEDKAIDWAELSASENILPFDVILAPGDPSCFGNDPDLLMNWWYGDNVWTSGRSCWNTTAEWTQLQTLMQTARQEVDATKQQSIWNDCFNLIAENCPIYPLFHREIATAYDSRKLQNFRGIGTTGLVFLGTKVVD